MIIFGWTFKPICLGGSLGRLERGTLCVINLVLSETAGNLTSFQTLISNMPHFHFPYSQRDQCPCLICYSEKANNLPTSENLWWSLLWGLGDINLWTRGHISYLSFSPHMQFLVKFTDFIINRFLTNVRKSQQNQFYNKKASIWHMWRHSPHHTHTRCGEISDFSTSINQSTCREISDFSTFIMQRNLKFLHATFSPPLRCWLR